MDAGHRESLELQELDLNDLESQVPAHRRTISVRRIWNRGDQSPRYPERGNAAASTRTASSAWGSFTSTLTGSFKRTMTRLSEWNASTAHGSSSQMSSMEGPPRKAFIFAVTQVSEENHSEILRGACRWYTSFLEGKIRTAWSPLFMILLAGNDPNVILPSDDDIDLAFKLFETIIKVLREKKEASLVDIVDTLYNEGLLRYTDDERSAAKQLVFIALGWICLFYSPNVNPRLNTLSIVPPKSFPINNLDEIEQFDPDGPVFGIRSWRQYTSKTFTQYSQDLESVDRPLHMLFNRFGAVMPVRSGRNPRSQESTSRREIEEMIDPNYIGFHILHRVASVKIEWVDNLSLHLEFDSHAKTLKVFRFPSLCRIMCCNSKKHPSLMSLIFNEASPDYSYRSDISNQACDYFKEVLLTYRIIFSQTKYSPADCFSAYQETWSHSEDYLQFADPLLQQLCSQSWDTRELHCFYMEINSGDPSAQYSPSSDFPFFGKRLLDLQAYVKTYRPSSIWALWYDQRNESWWWAFWPVVVIGLVTLVLTFMFASLQTILQIVQVDLAKKQLKQGAHG